MTCVSVLAIQRELVNIAAHFFFFYCLHPAPRHTHTKSTVSFTKTEIANDQLFNLLLLYQNHTSYFSTFFAGGPFFVVAGYVFLLLLSLSLIPFLVFDVSFVFITIKQCLSAHIRTWQLFASVHNLSIFFFSFVGSRAFITVQRGHFSTAARYWFPLQSISNQNF